MIRSILIKLLPDNYKIDNSYYTPPITYSQIGGVLCSRCPGLEDRSEFNWHHKIQQFQVNILVQGFKMMFGTPK